VRRSLLATAGLAGSTLASVLLADAVDRRRIKADPLWARLQEPPAGTERSVMGAGGTPLHVETYGPQDAPPVVLIHGWVCSVRFWRLQVQTLMADHHVIAYDARGHGRSSTPHDGDWSLDTLADDLEAVLDATLGDDRPALLAGHSLGAMTIAAWAGRHATAVEKRTTAVAMINTGLGDLISESLLIRTPDAFGRARQLIGSAVLGVGAPLPPRPDPIVHRAVRHIALSPSASPAAVRFSEEMILSTKPRVRAGSGRELSRMNLLDRVEHLTCPTLVVCGGRDLLTPPAHAHRLSEALPHCVGVLELEGAGHMGPLERDAEVSAALRDLVVSPGSAPRAAPGP
jgi:pimeloyl-ACP methyl ester carboxylesterase